MTKQAGEGWGERMLVIANVFLLSMLGPRCGQHASVYSVTAFVRLCGSLSTFRQCHRGNYNNASLYDRAQDHSIATSGVSLFDIAYGSPCRLEGKDIYNFKLACNSFASSF